MIDPNQPSGESDRFLTLSYLDELAETPGLLADYAMLFADRPHATLVVLAPGFDGDEVGRALAPLASALGLDREDSADVVVLVEEGADERLAATADAVYTRTTRGGHLSALPQIGDAGELARLSAPRAPEPIPVLESSDERFLSLGFLDELAATPDLLADYAQLFAGRANATLFVVAPGFEGVDLERELRPLVESLGLDRAGSADIVVLTDDGAADELAAQASAVYTRISRNGRLANLPQIGDAGDLARFAAGEPVGTAGTDLRLANDPPVDLSPLERLATDAPQFHFDSNRDPIGWHSNELLPFLDGLLRPGMKTLETGSGYSTVLFVAHGCEHIAVTFVQTEIDLVAAYCRESGYAQPTFLVGSSTEELPRLDGDVELDVALIDGAHAFPYPIVDYAHAARMLRVGGVLLVDDTNLPAPLVLARFLHSDPHWETMHLDGSFAAFRKLEQEPYPWDHWPLQPFSVMDVGLLGKALDVALGKDQPGALPAADDSAGRFLAFAFLDEIAATPDVLAEFAQLFEGRTDATLVVLAEGFESLDIEQALRPLVAAVGLDREDSADVLVVVDREQADRLAASGGAVYSRIDRNGSWGLPQVANAGALARLADAATRSTAVEPPQR